MRTSLAHPTTLPCRGCQQPVAADVWLVVDDGERPDLIQRAANGALRRDKCPRCGTGLELPPAPVLVYRRNATPPLVFATASGTTEAASDQEALIALGRSLRNALGETWKDDWVHHIELTSLAALPLVLTPDTNRRLRNLLSEVLRLPWSDRRSFVDRHPELLGDLALAVLDDALAAADRALEREAEDRLTELRALLVRSREVGVTAAFDERSPMAVVEAAVPQYDMPSLQRLLRELAAEGVDVRRPEAVLDAVRENPAREQLLAAGRSEGLSAMLAEIEALRGPENIPRRADLLRRAIDQIPAGVDDELRARLHFELGGTLLQPVGRREDAINEAVASYERALELTPPNDRSGRRYAALKNLSSAYRLRASPEDLDKAEAALADATKLANHEDAEEYASLLLARANLLRSRANEGSAGNALIEKAIALCREILRHDRIPPASPVRGAALYVLGLVHGEIKDGKRVVNLIRAARYCDRARSVRTRERDPMAWFGATAARARILAELARCTEGRGATEAATDYASAVSFARATGQLVHARDLAVALAEFHVSRGEWPAAADAYTHALDVAEQLFAAAGTTDLQRTVLHEAPGLPADAAFALAKAGRLDRAAVALERGRARGLARFLDTKEVDLREIERRAPALSAAYRAAASRVLRVQAYERGGDDLAGNRPVTPEAMRNYANRAADDLSRAVDAIRTLGGMPDFLRPRTLTDIVSALHEHEAAVYFALTDGGTAALLARPNQELAVVFSTLTTTDVEAAIAGTPREGGYLKGQLGDAHALHQALPDLLRSLGSRLMGPIAESLRDSGARHAVLVPGGLLSLLPLHAAEYEDDAGVRRPIDEFAIVYAPSVYALGVSRSSAARGHGPYLAGIGNPLPTPRPLVYAELELERVGALFDPARRDLLYGEAGDEVSALLAASKATHVHLACHGFFNPDTPLDSYLALAHGDRLTVRDVMNRGHFDGVRLVVLSACQTALTEFRRLPDESIGLPAAFLRAGTAGVIGALWPVDDVSTAVLMILFYTYHLLGDVQSAEGPMAPSVALQRAQRRLATMTRDEVDTVIGTSVAPPGSPARRRLRRPEASGSSDPRPFEHPYHWAGFTFTGS